MEFCFENNMFQFTGKEKEKFTHFIEYPYDIIQVIVEGRMMNKSYEEIVNCIYSLYKNSKMRAKVQLKGADIIYIKPQPVCFEILIDNGEISLNFAVNQSESTYFKNRLHSILPLCDCMYKDKDYIEDFIDYSMYEYNYEKSYICSLDTNHEKSPIRNLLELKKDVKEGEILLFQVQINPINNQHWKEKSWDAQDKMRKGIDVVNKSSIVGKIFDGLFNAVDETFDIIDEVLETRPEKTNETELRKLKSKLLMDNIHSYSTQKPNYDGFKCVIRSYIKSKNESTIYALGKSVETCLKDMSGDNQLKMSKRKTVKKEDIKRKYNPLDILNNNILSTLEVAQFLKLPDGAIQKRLGMQSINFRKVNPPREMIGSDENNMKQIKIGNVYKNGFRKNVIMPQTRDLMCLPTFILTLMGGGKTSLLLNIANDCINKGDGLIAFDYIDENQLANGICDLHMQTYKIEFDHPSKLITFAFPELEFNDEDDIAIKRSKANSMSEEVIYLIDALTNESDKLSQIMRNILKCACNIVFVNIKKTLLDVIDVLEDEDIRNEYIKTALEKQIFNARSFEIRTLRKLNEGDNKRSLSALLERFGILQGDNTFQQMLEQPYEKNINFKDIMENGIPVVICMKQSDFTNSMRKDVMCTYLNSRIRLGMSVRKNRDKVCHVIIDELHQIQNTLALISNTISEHRKFSLHYIFTMHNFNQIKNPTIKANLIDIGCNFMLLKGCTVSAFNDLKPYLDDFDYEDIMKMNYKYGSLNLFSVDGYKAFISELPEPLRDNKGKLYI